MYMTWKRELIGAALKWIQWNFYSTRPCHGFIQTLGALKIQCIGGQVSNAAV